MARQLFAGGGVERVEVRVAAAAIPACRIAPPKSCLKRRAAWMKSFDPARTAPIGAPSPFVKSIQTESTQAAKSAAGTPAATDAFLQGKDGRVGVLLLVTHPGRGDGGAHGVGGAGFRIAEKGNDGDGHIAA